MTNKEVIEQLKGIRSDYEKDCKHSLFKDMLYRKDIEALNIAIKTLEEKLQGEWVRKEDVIHSIAKQYSEHNELVPIWLGIGDVKGDAKNKLDYKVINRGKCMLCGKELTEGLFFCKECEQKGDKK